MLIKSCYKCKFLKTNIGFCELHHWCKKNIWIGSKSTPHHYFPEINCKLYKNGK